VATIVEEKDINGLQTKQFIRFVVLLKDGTFTSVLMTDRLNWVLGATIGVKLAFPFGPPS
jgi:hypothetical protein